MSAKQTAREYASVVTAVSTTRLLPLRGWICLTLGDLNGRVVALYTREATERDLGQVAEKVNDLELRIRTLESLR